MSPELSVQLSVLGMASLYVFKALIVYSALQRKSIRFLAAVGLSVSLLVSTADSLKGTLSGMNLTTSGLCFIVCAFMISEALNVPGDQPRKFPDMVLSYLQFLLQEMEPVTNKQASTTPTKPSQPPPTYQQQLQRFLASLSLAGAQYIIYDAILVWLSQYPYATLTAQPLGFRLLHSFIFGIALYLMFQTLVIPVFNLPWVFYPEGAARSVKAFRSPWLTTSPQDFWSNRWHQFFRNTLMQLAFHPTRHICKAIQTQLKASSVAAKGPLVTLMSFLQKALPIFSCFILSGLIHEYQSWASLGANTWHQLLFFVLHGALVVMEGVVKMLAPNAQSTIPQWAKMLGMYCLLVATAPLFFEPWIRADIHLYFWRPVQLTTPWLRYWGLVV